MNQPIQIQLTVEEGLEYQRFDAEMSGYIQGVQATVEFMRRGRINAILAARKPTPAPPAEASNPPSPAPEG